MQNITQVPVNGNGGAWTTIRCTLFTSRMEIREDGVAAGQGLEYQLLNPDGSVKGPVVTVPASAEPIVIAGYPGDIPSQTAPLGNPGSGGNPVAPGAGATLGTPVVQVRSATATATTIDVTEWAA